MSRRWPQDGFRSAPNRQQLRVICVVSAARELFRVYVDMGCCRWWLLCVVTHRSSVLLWEMR